MQFRMNRVLTIDQVCISSCDGTWIPSLLIESQTATCRWFGNRIARVCGRVYLRVTFISRACAAGDSCLFEIVFWGLVVLML